MRGVVFALKLIALALIIMAMARPQSGDTVVDVTADGVDIILVLDVSGSMKVKDLGPDNRLAVAKDVVAEFVEGRLTDRLGMVVFAGESFTQCPLTLDYDVLLSFLEQIRIAEQDWDGTAIGMAMINATNRLRDADGRSQVVILLTDGVNNAGEIDPLTAAEVAAAVGVRVYAIGVGAPGSGGRGRGRGVDFDEETLKQVASLTGGRYYHATSGEKLAEIYDEIGKLETAEITSQVHVEYTERYGAFLWPCLVLVLFEFTLARTRLRTIP
jgi:Ca-activated chloride channel family protein